MNTLTIPGTSITLINNARDEDFRLEFAYAPTLRDLHEGLALAGGYGLVPLSPNELPMEHGDDGSVTLWLVPVAYAEMAREIDAVFAESA
ncbi:hypothetical protein [Jiangella mangrovi]|uniref:Uncharacterized protein n=1 Tax=Jiangella mangrovi TaxID=1524084 RepID=A0A7W9LPT9_9ACTN|nr:hypothetical protein [Jiangella mangrovi]MBB5791773.1 hypothetical protein [Jiangella mangrovi]